MGGILRRDLNPTSIGGDLPGRRTELVGIQDIETTLRYYKVSSAGWRSRFSMNVDTIVGTFFSKEGRCNTLTSGALPIDCGGSGDAFQIATRGSLENANSRIKVAVADIDFDSFSFPFDFVPDSR